MLAGIISTADAVEIFSGSSPVDCKKYYDKADDRVDRMKNYLFNSQCSHFAPSGSAIIP